MIGIKEMIKTVEGIKELAFILSVPVEVVKKVADNFKQEEKEVKE